MDYQGYKLLDKIMLVCRDLHTYDDGVGWNTFKKKYQAYLVDPANKKQLETARHWAKWTEYGGYHKNEETGLWEYEHVIQHEPVEFEFDNSGFTFELLDCAGGSSQGGKLSFWNCMVTKDGTEFVIGINSDMLLELLKDATFINGKCQSPLMFITLKGKVGMTVKDSEIYKQCIKDAEIKTSMKSTQTSKFSFGDIVSTPTLKEVYLGTITQYYKFDDGGDDSWRYSARELDLRKCTITKLAKPITYHLFEGYYVEPTLSAIVSYYEQSNYAYPSIKKTCPKRTITDKITLDYSEEEFKQRVSNKIYDFDAHVSYAKDNYRTGYCDKKHLLYYFLSKQFFGYGFEPFDLDPELMDKIKDFGIKYIEE